MVETSWATASRKLPPIQNARISPAILDTLCQRPRLKSDRDHFWPDGFIVFTLFLTSCKWTIAACCGLFVRGMYYAIRYTKIF